MTAPRKRALRRGPEALERWHSAREILFVLVLAALAFAFNWSGNRELATGALGTLGGYLTPRHARVPPQLAIIVGSLGGLAVGRWWLT